MRARPGSGASPRGGRGRRVGAGRIRSRAPLFPAALCLRCADLPAPGRPAHAGRHGDCHRGLAPPGPASRRRRRSRRCGNSARRDGLPPRRRDRLQGDARRHAHPRRLWLHRRVPRRALLSGRGGAPGWRDGQPGPAPRRRAPRRRAGGLMSYGRYYEEFAVGQVFKHWPGRTITEADCTWFALLTMNQHPLHSDAHFAETYTQHKQRVVLGPLVYSVVIGMTVADISGRAIANLEVNELKHEKPTFIGDTLYAKSRVLALRESRQGDRGIVTVG